MRTSLLPRSLLLVLVNLCLLGLAQASTVVIPSDEELIIGARAIVRGTVLSSVSGYDERHGAIFTYTTLQVQHVLKGLPGVAPSTEIIIKEPGGIVGNLGSTVFGIPQFSPREEVLLYLDTWPDGSLRVYQWFLGKYRISFNSISGLHELSRETAEPNVTIRGRSPRGISTDQSDLNSYLERLKFRIAALAIQSEAHEERYYSGNAVSSIPDEYPQVEADARSPNYTLINPYQPQRWFEPDEGRSLVFSVNPIGLPNSRMIDDIRAALQVWSNVAGSSIRLVLGGETSTCGLSSVDGVNTISFNNCDQYSSFSPPVNGGCAGVLAAAGISNFDTTQRKTVSGIVFYRAIEGNVSFNPFASCYFNDSCNVREIATHEFGHALGLGHSRDPDASLYAYAHFDGRCGTLRADDEDGIRFLYPQVTQVQTPVIATVSLPGAQAEMIYEFDLVASGGVPPYLWQVVAGSLPEGLTLTGSGSLRGTPTSPGETAITFQATDTANQSVQRRMVLTVKPKPSTFTPGPVVDNGGLQFYPLTSPVRWLDTRSGSGTCNSPRSPISSGSPLRLSLRGQCFNSSIPANAAAVVGQATVINLTRNQGSYQIVAAGSGSSTAGAVTYNPLQTNVTTFTTALNSEGAVEIHTSNQVHLVIEIIGYFAPPGTGGLYFHPLPNSIRLVDTQASPGSCVSYNQPLGTGGTHIERATVTCRGVSIPANARVIVGNATVSNTSPNNGFVTIYPSRTPRPNTVNVQSPVSSTVTNQVVVALGQGGLFTTYSSTRVNLTLDIMGYYSADEADINGEGLLYYPLNNSMRLVETRLAESGCYSFSRPLNANQDVQVSARLTCNGVKLSNEAQSVTGYATVINQSSSGGILTLFPGDQSRPGTSNIQYSVNGSTPNSFTVRLGNNGAFKLEAGSTINLFLDLTGYFAPQ